MTDNVEVATGLVDWEGLRESGVWTSGAPSRTTIMAWTKSGRIPSYKIGGRRYYDPREVLAYIRKHWRQRGVLG